MEPRDDGAVFIPDGCEVTIGGKTVTVPEEGALYKDGVLMLAHTVTFDSKGGSEVDTATVPYGETVTESEEPELAGHTFGSWYTDEDCTDEYDFSAPVTENITLYAKWTANVYTVTFEYEDENGDTVSVEKKVTYSETKYGDILPELADKSGYFFMGWYDENDMPVDVDALVSESCTLHPVWTDCRHEDENMSGWKSDGNETHSRTCGVCGWVEMAAHSRSTTTTDAACTAAGTITSVCAICKEEKTETVKPLDHDWSTRWSKDEEKHWHDCSRRDEIKDEAEHEWDEGKVTKEATATEKGEMTYTCETCGYSRTEEIPAIGGGTATPPSSEETTDPESETTTSEAETTTPEPETTTSNTETIAPKPVEDDPNAGNVIVDSNSGDNAPSVSINSETVDRLK